MAKPQDILNNKRWQTLSDAAEYVRVATNTTVNLNGDYLRVLINCNSIPEKYRMKVNFGKKSLWLVDVQYLNRRFNGKKGKWFKENK